MAVGRPGGPQLFGSVGLSSGETASGNQLCAGQQVSRFCRRIESLNEKMDLPVVEPTIPVSNWESVVDSGVVLPGLAFGRDPLVGFVICRSGIDRAVEEQRLAVGTPDRILRAG